MGIVKAFVGVTVVLLALCVQPAQAQMDFSGEWSPNGNEDSGGDPPVGDWFGIPLNDAGRARAEAWDASIQSLPEWQCRPHGWAYIARGPTSMRIWKEVDPVSRELVAYKVEFLQSDPFTIWMDGRPHPPEQAAHTWGGFSTGEWEGDTLKITTTHIKEDYVRRNGVQHSDLAKITTYWSRRGDLLTWLTIVYDPVYLTQPFIRAIEHRFNPGQQLPAHPCTVVAEVDRPNDVVPHVLPGTNKDLSVFTTEQELPADSIFAGEATMYPEFRTKVQRPRK